MTDIEAIKKNITSLQEKNEATRRAIEEEKKIFVERQVKIFQLREEIGKNQRLIEELKGKTTQAQEQYQNEFQNIKESNKKAVDTMNEIINQRRDASSFLTQLCQDEADLGNKVCEALEGSSYVKAEEEINKMAGQKNLLIEEIAECEKKIELIKKLRLA